MGALGEALGVPWAALGAPRGDLGAPRGALGTPRVSWRATSQKCLKTCGCIELLRNFVTHIAVNVIIPYLFL